MRNELSRAEMINLALSQAGQPTIPNIDKAQSEQAQKALLFWKRSYQALISTHPYNFSTKRAALATRKRQPGSPYNFSYEIPADAKIIWDLYTTEPSVFASPERIGRFAQAYYTLPYSGTLQFERGGAEIVSDALNLDSNSLNMLYTVSSKIQTEEYGPYFVEEMIQSIQMMVLKSKGADVGTLGIHSRMNDKMSQRNRRRASNENNDARRVPKSTILNVVDQGIYG